MAKKKECLVCLVHLTPCDKCLQKKLSIVIKSLPTADFPLKKFGSRVTIADMMSANKKAFLGILSKFSKTSKKKLGLGYMFMWNTRFSENWGNWDIDFDKRKEQKLMERLNRIFDVHEALALHMNLVPAEYDSLLAATASGLDNAIVIRNDDS